ncbi:hypothetical protein TNIN_133451 [Trichonephila inaurata madagascariensis]|uniref:Uncharacterized protein n=1 Tax=Trichonephila inaurata madagascariensis TaxID=2747483 RepID=A0A8X7C328_9ARAC|nr:hypothetical protein TNIN_133451 [Trichonephila inaurata madagascariensis]
MPKVTNFGVCPFGGRPILLRSHIIRVNYCACMVFHKKVKSPKMSLSCHQQFNSYAVICWLKHVAEDVATVSKAINGGGF